MAEKWEPLLNNLGHVCRKLRSVTWDVDVHARPPSRALSYEMRFVCHSRHVVCVRFVSGCAAVCSACEWKKAFAVPLFMSRGSLPAEPSIVACSVLVSFHSKTVDLHVMLCDLRILSHRALAKVISLAGVTHLLGACRAQNAYLVA